MKMSSRSIVACLPLLFAAASVSAQVATTKPSAKPAEALTSGYTTPMVTAPLPVTDPVSRGSRVLVISIDGCRPDVALRANMPNLRKLLAEGAFSMYARTTDVAITLPSHTSMITGVTPDRHLITWNDDADESKFRYPAYPTLMELAHAAGYSTAVVSAKSKFTALTKPGTVDWTGVPSPKTGTKAPETAEKTRAIIESHKPQVMLVHFGDPDNAGHGIGWGSPQQVEALEKVDVGLGVIFKAMKDAGVYDQTLIIVSADHGGFAKTHGANDLRAAFIPWICVGPNVKKGYDLTRIKEVAIRTEDTFATSAAFLGLRYADDIDGKPVTAIWQRDELMQDAPAKKTPAPKTSSAK